MWELLNAYRFDNTISCNEMHDLISKEMRVYMCMFEMKKLFVFYKEEVLEELRYCTLYTTKPKVVLWQNTLAFIETLSHMLTLSTMW